MLIEIWARDSGSVWRASKISGFKGRRSLRNVSLWRFPDSANDDDSWVMPDISGSVIETADSFDMMVETLHNLVHNGSAGSYCSEEVVDTDETHCNYCCCSDPDSERVAADFFRVDWFFVVQTDLG